MSPIHDTIKRSFETHDKIINFQTFEHINNNKKQCHARFHAFPTVTLHSIC